ncbi:hypothetical protein [Streptomyces sp. NPDC054804]
MVPKEPPGRSPQALPDPVQEIFLIVVRSLNVQSPEERRSAAVVPVSGQPRCRGDDERGSDWKWVPLHNQIPRETEVGQGHKRYLWGSRFASANFLANMGNVV